MAAAARFSPTLVRCVVSITKPNGPVVVVCCSCGGGVPWRRRPDLAPTLVRCAVYTKPNGPVVVVMPLYAACHGGGGQI